jgi:hypothetical protein
MRRLFLVDQVAVNLNQLRPHFQAIVLLLHILAAPLAQSASLRTVLQQGAQDASERVLIG